jgi:hypothetical protein
MKGWCIKIWLSRKEHVSGKGCDMRDSDCQRRTRFMSYKDTFAWSKAVTPVQHRAPAVAVRSSHKKVVAMHMWAVV